MASPLFSRIDLAGPYRLPPASQESMSVALSEAGITPLRIPAPAAGQSRADWFAGAARALALPSSFGGNFDALYDSLCDTQLLPQTLLVLLIEDTSALGEEGTDTLIAVLQAAADEWREQQRALWPLFLASNLDLDPLPTAKA